MSIDDQLAGSAPITTSRTPELQRAIEALIAEAEAVARRPRRRFRLVLVAAAAAGAVGVSTAAVAASGLFPVPWVTGSGSSCEMSFDASAAGPDGEPLSRKYTAAERERAESVASSFLASFDYRSINEEDAIRAYQKRENAAIAAQADPTERQPRLTGNDLAITAVGAEVQARVSDRLRSEGIPSELIVFGQGWRCE